MKYLGTEAAADWLARAHSDLDAAARPLPAKPMPVRPWTTRAESLGPVTRFMARWFTPDSGLLRPPNDGHTHALRG